MTAYSKPIWGAIFLLCISSPHCGILSFEWQKFEKDEEYIGAAFYPLGWAIANNRADVGTLLKVSNCFQGGVGIQGPTPYSTLGLYFGPLYRFKDDKYGFSSSLTATALFFNFYLAHEYVGYNAMKIGIGLGMPYIWWIPNRKDRKA